MIDVVMQSANGVTLATNGKYCAENVKVSISNAENLVPENIKSGVQIADVVGTLEGGSGGLNPTIITFDEDTNAIDIPTEFKKKDIVAISIDAFGDIFVSSGNAYVGTMLYWPIAQNGTHGIVSANNWGNLQGKKIAEDFIVETSSGFSVNLPFGVFKSGVNYAIAIYPKGE